MTEELEQNKIDKIKDILPLLWSSYEHIYEVRETNTNNSINFLMIVATFLPIFCLMLYTTFNCPLFLFPILFQITALLILLKRFFIKGQIPWLKSEETLKRLDDNSFAAWLFATLKAAENDTYSRLKALRTLIKISLFLLVFSIFLTILSYVFLILDGNSYLYLTTGVLMLLFLLLYFLFYKRVSDSQFNVDENSFKNYIDEWRKKH